VLQQNVVSNIAPETDAMGTAAWSTTGGWVLATGVGPDGATGWSLTGTGSGVNVGVLVSTPANPFLGKVREAPL